jgi:hypothetical protein
MFGSISYQLCIIQRYWVIVNARDTPLAFTSKQLCDENMGISTYEKEMMSIIHAVDMWHPYLIRHHFHIKANHGSLKYLLEHRLPSPEQQKWVTKMLGYDYEIIYMKCSNSPKGEILLIKPFPCVHFSVQMVPYIM